MYDPYVGYDPDDYDSWAAETPNESLPSSGWLLQHGFDVWPMCDGTVEDYMTRFQSPAPKYLPHQDPAIPRRRRLRLIRGGLS